jgi:hypothetical protein
MVRFGRELALALCGWLATSLPATSADLGLQPREPLVEPAPLTNRQPNADLDMPPKVRYWGKADMARTCRMSACLLMTIADIDSRLS